MHVTLAYPSKKLDKQQDLCPEWTEIRKRFECYSCAFMFNFESVPIHCFTVCGT